MSRFDLVSTLLNDSSLLAFYPFNGNSSDLSGHGNNGTDTSISYDFKYSPFTAVKGAYLNNASSAKIGLGTGLNPTSAMSAAFWIYIVSRPNNPGFNTIFARWGSAGGNQVYTCYIDGGGGTFALGLSPNGTTQQYAGGNTALSNGIWYHLAFTWTSGATNFYLNGIQDATTATNQTGIVSQSRTTYVGAMSDGTGSFGNFYIKDLAIFSRVLTQIEVIKLASLNKSFRSMDFVNQL